MQFPKELRPSHGFFDTYVDHCLNEVQFPKELRQKESTRRCHVPWGLNEVQFPKELRRWLVRVGLDG